MNFNDINFYILFSIVVGIMVLSFRAFDWNNQRKILKKAADSGMPLQREHVSMRRVWTYVLLLGSAVGLILMMDEVVVTKIALASVFMMLLISEIIGAYTSYALFVNDREFLYGSDLMRFKTIRSFKPRNKRNVEIHGLNGTMILVPKDIATRIQAKKDAKKQRSE